MILISMSGTHRENMPDRAFCNPPGLVIYCCFKERSPAFLGGGHGMGALALQLTCSVYPR